MDNETIRLIIRHLKGITVALEKDLKKKEGKEDYALRDTDRAYEEFRMYG